MLDRFKNRLLRKPAVTELDPEHSAWLALKVSICSSRLQKILVTCFVSREPDERGAKSFGRRRTVDLMAGALAAGVVGQEFFSAACASLLKNVEPRRPTRDNSTAAALSFDRKTGRVARPLCDRVKVAREIRVSRVVADRTIPDVLLDRELRSPRSSSGENESPLLIVSRENLLGAVELTEVLVRGNESESRVVVPSDGQSSAVSDCLKKANESSVSRSWEDKFRDDNKPQWWSDAGSSKLCMVEEIVNRLRCAAGQQSNLKSLLAPFAGKVSLRVATLVLRRFPQTTAPLEFCNWVVKHQSLVEWNLSLYHALVQCLLRDRQWVGVDIILSEMSKKQCLPDSALYRKIIKAASDAGSPKVAGKWLQKMIASCSVPHLSVWNSVLAAYARDGSFKEVFFLYEQLKAHGFVGNRITYCALLSACRNAGKVQEAREILSEMKSRGMQPNRIVYSVLVDLYGKAGMPDSAAATFRQMEKAGYEPDQVAYNTLIHAFVKSGMIDEATKAFKRAIKLGGHIDPVIFSTMINLYANVGLVEAARDVLQTMKKYSFDNKHYQYAYTILLNAYARVGQFREAVGLFDEIQTAGYPVGDRIYTTMLNVYFKVDRLRCAEELFGEMNGTGKCKNIVAFGTMINIYGRMGRLEDAVRIFNSLKESGFRGNTVIYNTLIYCHGKNRNLGAAEEYVKDMKLAGLKPDRVTYSSLIKAYNKSGKPCDAIRIYNQMRSASVSLDKLVVGTMVNTFGKLRRYEELVQLLEETRQERVRPDERLLRSVIDVYDTTQLEDCSPDTFRRFGDLLIAMEQAVNWDHGGGEDTWCVNNQDQSSLGYQDEEQSLF